MSMDIAASAMRAAGVRIGVSAHNIANINTPDYKAQRAIHKEQSTGRWTDIYTTRSENGPDLGQELVDSLVSKRYLQANAVSFSYAAERMGTLIDMFA